ncbi:hypothetical protein ABH931_003769 [Streptacidiphilus sp. MAP12-33]
MHKDTASEILLTGWQDTGQDTFKITARWPGNHPFYKSAAGFHDPMLVAETVRQAVPLLSHVAYGVPFGHRQSWSHFRYDLTPEGLATDCGPTDVELLVTCADLSRRGSVLAGMTMQVELVANGRPLGTAESTFRNHPPAVYRRLRGDRAEKAWGEIQDAPVPPGVPSGSVRRSRQADVVLSPADERSAGHRLRVDPRHPVLFDHPLDHVPGMLLLEAARQAAHSAMGPYPLVPTALDATFARYGEFDSPCGIQAERVSGVAGDPANMSAHRRPLVLVTAVQDEEQVFSALVRFEPC